ncbi:MAG: hypothetical protein ACREA0_30350 [bacterium]
MRNKISIVFLVAASLSAFLAPHAEAETNPPVCSFDATSGRGTATDNKPDVDTGIFSVELDPGSTNLALDVDPFEPGAGEVGFTMTAPDPTRAGTGSITATDGGNFDGDVNTCNVEVEILPNAAPTASNVLITGTPRVGEVLTGSYTYADARR